MTLLGFTAAAVDLLNTPWYHGTNAELRVGDEVTAGMGARHGDDNDVVWVSDNAWEAHKYGSLVYLVEPHSTPKKRGKAHEFYVTGATVLSAPISVNKILEDSERAMQKGY